MAIGAAIGKIFGMLDKLDDIVYEPVKLVCDAVRKPLETHFDEKEAEHTQKLERQKKQFEADLQFDKQQREMELQMEQQRQQMNLNKEIGENDLRMRDEIIQFDKKYRDETSAAYVQLAIEMNKMHKESREELSKMTDERITSYRHAKMSQLREIRDFVAETLEIFSDEDDITAAIKPFLNEQMHEIADEAKQLINDVRMEAERLGKIFDNRIERLEKEASAVLTPADPNQPALTQKVVNMIERK